MYGSDAKGGVINIITKKAPAKPQTAVALERGGFGQERYRLSTSGKTGKIGYSFGFLKDITGDYTDAKGNKWVSQSNTAAWNAKLSAELTSKSDLTFAVERYIGHYRYNNWYDSSSYQYKKTVNQGSASDLKLRMIWDYRFSEKLKNQLSFYTHHSLTDYNTWLMDLETTGVSDQVTVKLGKYNELVGGFDIYREKVKDYVGEGGFEKYDGKNLTTKALYVQDRWDVTDKFNLMGGLRYTHHSKAGGNTSLAATAGYDFDKNTNAYVSYKQYFIAPNQYQFFGYGGNENLKAERGYTYEMGVSHKFDDTFNAQFHIFRRKSSDKITWAGNGYENIDKETGTGWDISLNKAFTSKLMMNVGYTHIKVKSEPGQGVSCYDRLIPGGEWHIGLNYDDHKAWAASVVGRGVIARPGPVANMFPQNTYWVFDAAVNYMFKPNVRLYMKANNIFNQYYAEVSEVNYSRIPDQWYAAPGRNFVLGVDYTF